MATTRALINIPNHPTINSITRKADIIKGENCYKANSVALFINVLHYLDGQLISEKEVRLYTDNSDMINPQTFALVERDETTGEYPPGSVGEYDFLYSLVRGGNANQLQLEEQYINMRIDRIDQKLYGTGAPSGPRL